MQTEGTKPVKELSVMRLKILSITAVLATFALASTVAAANPDHVRRLQTTNACPGCDLSRANLRGWNLHNADLRNADLSYADLREADLSKANLTGANLYGALR